jgi:DNA-binding MarR family transcriptional regulator
VSKKITLGPTQVAVLRVFTRARKGSDPCYSVAAICEKTGLSYVNASRVIKRLSDLGFLGVIKGPPHFYRLKEELPLFVECKLAKGK